MRTAARSFVARHGYGWIPPDVPFVSSMFLGRVTMQMLDKDAARSVLGSLRPRLPREATRTLLDVGAGPGDTTAQLGVHFSAVSAVETSWPCARQLRARGFDAHSDDSALGRRRFDVVSLQNVLDRCADATSLLRTYGERVAPGGRLWVGLRLPVDAFTMSWDGSVAPQKPLLPKALREAATWEVAAGAAAAFLEETTGFELERLSRVPYLLSLIHI